MRISSSPEPRDPGVEQVLQRQATRWGAALKPYEVYARRPSIFQAVVGMWDGLADSGLLDRRLTTLINRRVAALNGCVF